MDALPDPWAVLKDIVNVSEDTNQVKNSYLSKEPHTPFWPSSYLYRIRSGLWQLQLYWDLFHFTWLETCETCKDVCHGLSGAPDAFFDRFTPQGFCNLYTSNSYIANVFEDSRVKSDSEVPPWIQRFFEGFVDAEDGVTIRDGGYHEGDFENLSHFSLAFWRLFFGILRVNGIDELPQDF